MIQVDELARELALKTGNAISPPLTAVLRDAAQGTSKNRRDGSVLSMRSRLEPGLYE